MGVFVQDIRSGCRLLWRQPGFAAAVILCLGLGIGGVTAVLSVINGLSVRFMPYAQPGRLMFLVRADTFGGGAPLASARYYLDWKTQNRSFSGIAAYQRHEPHIGWVGWAQTQENLMDLQGLTVTPNLFSVLGLRTLRGRALMDSDTGQPVIVLGYHVWHDKFAEDPQIIGRSITLGGQTREVVGVAAPNYRFLPTAARPALNRRVDYWMPVSRDFESEIRTNWNYAAIARLRPGITIAQAQADMNRITHDQHEQYRDDFPENARIVVQSMPQTLLGPIRSAAALSLAAAGFVLLIACANVTNLLLVHAMRRRTEMAVRTALGSSRWRILRQLICENIVLVLLGGILGVLLAWWGMEVLLGVAPRNLPGVDQIRLDARVLAGALAITLLSAIAVGSVPGLAASRLNLTSVLKEFGTRTTSGFGERRTIQLVVVAEIVLSFVLVIGASLLGQSYWRLLQVDLGFPSSHVLALRLSGPNLGNRHGALLERLQSLPGVEGAGSSTGLPLSGEPSDTCLMMPVSGGEPPESCPTVYMRTVSTDYLRVLGVPLARGRHFTAQDEENSSPVVIVNEALARRLWPEKDPVGQLVDFVHRSWVFFAGREDKLVQRQVIGVVRNVRYGGPDQDPPLEAFIPFAQRTRGHFLLSVVLRSGIDPAGLMRVVQQEVRSVDPSFKVESTSTIDAFYAELTAPRRFLMAMLAAFAVVAFTLAVVGIYGVVAFTVSLRVREMGIRMTFGARRWDILRLVLKDAAVLVLAGVGLGLLGAFALRKVIASQLFGISPLDPATLAVGVLLVVLVPLAACYLPARRAAQIDPMAALRQE